MSINLMFFILKIYTITVVFLYKLTLLPLLNKYRCNSDPFFKEYLFEIALSI